MITEDYVSFEVAKLLKEKGFPQDPHVCNTAYTSKGNLSNNAKSFVHNSETLTKCGVKPLHYSMAPTHQMAMKWLREIHKLFIMILLLEKEEGNYGYTVEKIGSREIISTSRNISYDTTEDACEAALKYTLENLI